MFLIHDDITNILMFKDSKLQLIFIHFQALRTFRQYKRIQERISKLTNSIDLLDDILHRISHAASEEMVQVFSS